MATDKAVRFVAYFEAAKGVIVLAAATGLLSLLHEDVYHVASLLIAQAHLDPAAKYPQIFLDLAAEMNNTRLWWLAAGAGLYCTLRFVEAYGLFYERVWAELLAALSGAIYVPFEIIGLIRHRHWHNAVLLLINLLIVALMMRALLRRRRLKQS